MRKARRLAPWHRKSLEGSGLDLKDEAVAEALAELHGRPAIYHCVSRVVNRDFVLKDEEREQFVAFMRRYEAFSQVKVRTFCVMTNHFHLLVEVPDAPADAGESWSDGCLLRHLELIYDKAKMAELRAELHRYREQGNARGAADFRERTFRRMWDLSQYLKILKQRFTQWFNRKHGRCGVLWEGRFDSELIEDGHAAQRVAAYIDLNPVRAGLVRDPKDWRWSGYGEAVAGKKTAQEGLRRILVSEAKSRMNEQRAMQEAGTGAQVLRGYRVILFAEGEEHARDESRKRAGIPRERVAEVLKSGGRLGEADLMWCRTRYFLDGVVLGSERFVNQVFVLMPGQFGETRKSGARKMRRVRSDLCTMRDLQSKALQC